MKLNRSILLIASIVLVLFLVGGGLAGRVGAADQSYRQAILFAEILSLVTENYVDPVETERLLDGAYEGLLSGLDTHGAYLTPEEVVAWKSESEEPQLGPGLAVLKSGRTLLVVGVEERSSAADAGISVGDQIRAVDGKAVVEASLEQARRMLKGPSGSRLTVSLVSPDEDFKPTDVELIRAAPSGKPSSVEVRRGVPVVRLTDLSRTSAEDLAEQLEQLETAGSDELLLDLRNVAEGSPRRAAELAGVFVDRTGLRLRDRAGRILDTVNVEADPAWSGKVSVLVNGATAAGGEALAKLLQSDRQATVFGEKTFGLGTEPRLFELEDGSGLLVSFGLWETPAGESWNADGIEPDTEVSGEGDDFDALAADQLSKVLDLIEAEREKKARGKAA